MRSGSARGNRRLRIAAWAVGLATLALGIPPPAVAAAAAKPSKADLAIQKQAVLRRSDLPAGWKSSPDQSSSSFPTLPACAGLQQVNDALEPVATDSPEFWKSDIVRIENSVVVLASTKQAKGWLTPYREPDAAACLEEAMKDAFTQPGIQGVRVYVAPIDDAPRGADEAAGFEIEITATSAPSAQQPAQTAVIVYDVLVARVGRALTNFAFANLTNPLPEQGELVDAVIGRLQDAGI
jgi:hypothetical protein